MPAPHIDNDDASPPQSGSTSFDCRGARMRATTDSGLTVMSISGEIDASNADELSHRVSELASDCGALIFDLAEVDFIALDGLHALIALHDQCARTGTTWALISSHAVNRVLRWGSRQATSRRRIGNGGPTTGSPIQPATPITAARWSDRLARTARGAAPPPPAPLVVI
jgi:anti-anti-sigma factor